MRIEKLKVNHFETPVGIDVSRPTFSFCVSGEGRGKIIKTRIQIAEDKGFLNVVYDSGEREDISPLSFTPDVKLYGGKRYFWSVVVTNEKGEKANGESYFEGGRAEKEWDLPWITTAGDNRKSSAFCRNFYADKTDGARLYITALGLYEAYINGKKVGDEFFTPYCDDYRYIIQYQTYDVTSLLKSGENEIVVLTGNGWFGGRYPAGENGDGMFGNGFFLSCELASGGEQILRTDENWREIKSPILFSEIYDGEIYDGKKEIFDEIGKIKIDVLKCASPVKIASVPSGKVIPRISPRVTAKERYFSTLITTPKGETVLDFGREITGWVEFYCNAKSGEKITFSYGEILQDGNFYRDNLRTAKASYCYLSNGVNRLIRPHFTYFGFRYVKIEGVEITRKTVKNFVGVSIYSDIGQLGKIETSNEKLNKFIENVFQSQKDNFLDIPTDCPQRDERFGWTGDAQIFSETALYNADCVAFFAKYLENMYEGQRRYGGACPFVVPDAFYAREERKEGDKHLEKFEVMSKRCSNAWGDAASVIPWNLYRFSGDKTLLERVYRNIKLWAEYLIFGDETEGKGRRIFDLGFQFGDWLALDNSDKNSPRGLTDEGFIASVYYLFSVTTAGKAAGVLGMTNDEKRYKKIAEEIKTAIASKYIKGDRLTTDTQTAYALAIAFDLMPLEVAGKRLHEKLVENDMKLNTGFVGTAFLLDSLTKAGYEKDAFTLILNEECPGWLYEVNMGATTVWERWNSVLPDGKISETGMNSLNHYAYGAVVSWVYKSIIGINIGVNGEGFRRVSFEPKIDERLKKVYGEYNSASGLYACGYEIEADKIRFELTVPYLGSAEFIPPINYIIAEIDGEMPNGKIALKGGKHTIICKKQTSKI